MQPADSQFYDHIFEYAESKASKDHLGPSDSKISIQVPRRDYGSVGTQSALVKGKEGGTSLERLNAVLPSAAKKELALKVPEAGPFGERKYTIETSPTSTDL